MSKLKEYSPDGFALEIFRDRYAIHPDETFREACERVARTMADAEIGPKRIEYFDKFLDLLLTNRFSPGGRTWRGAGRPRGQLLNCFMLPTSIDSREGWGDTLKAVTIISGTGGGVGINLSKVRPRGAEIRSSGGEATGSVSLMRCINAVCDELKSGGNRRSAIIFCLRYDHPDLPELLDVKLDKKELNNANISILIDDVFLNLVEQDKDIVFKWMNKEYGKIPARKIWHRLLSNALECGDPGILNIGLMQEENTISYLADGEICGCNPCGEIPLTSLEACTLGSINLHSHVTNGKIDWRLLNDTVATSVRFLDNVIEQNHYPMPEIQGKCQEKRRIGLGFMGLHDMLLELNVKYSSEKAREIVDRVMGFIKNRAYSASVKLAQEKGAFYSCDPEKHVLTGFVKRAINRSLQRRLLRYGIRNCAVLSGQPTGTTSIMAGCSSGIEPLFQALYKRTYNKPQSGEEQTERIVIHPLLQKFLQEGRDVSHFENAHDILPEDHLAMQATCQEHLCNSVSKTLNVPSRFTIEQLLPIIEKYIPVLKGITIYRDGSKGASPLTPIPVADAQKYLDEALAQPAVGECTSGTCDIGG